MNLDRCTPGQREVVETLDAPVMVAAGAGSGKTFTLTQRIVGALLPDADGGKPYLESVDQVLAITFTKKAAAELRSRIKGLLLKEGLRDQAQAIDDAWVSTIHGMASRILREHALEIGLDPSFEVISESLSDELREQAVDDIVREIRDMKPGENPLLDELVIEMPLFAHGKLGEGAVDLARKLLARVEAMPAGFDGLVLAEPACTPGDLMREALRLGLDFKEVALSWKKPGKREQECIDALEAGLAAIEGWFAHASDAGFLDADFDVEGYCEALFALPPTSQKFHDSEKKPDAGFFRAYRADYARIGREACAAIALRRVRAVVDLARMIQDRFGVLKGPSRLDNGDLLMKCAETLRAHPEIARRYRDQFKLIMIDEFQDTDKLQVSIVELLAQPSFGNVCTVGDAQQSIYRFRGADVNVFFEYRDALRRSSDRARFVSLPDNFRSHADVLALVDAVFSQQSAFGSEFLHLDARGAVNAQADPVFDGLERIQLDLVHYKVATAASSGVTRAEAVEEAAKRIAERFALLRDRGARPSEMAVLLGTMGNADVYARALRAVGLESVIAGGSVFSGTAEARLVADLLRFAVDESDEPALFSVLTSPLFSVSDDALLSLVTRCDDDGSFGRRPLWRGYLDCRIDVPAQLDDADARMLGLAVEALGRFRSRAHNGSVERALRQLFLETGLLDRLQGAGAVGLASAGNLAKAARLVGDLEAASCGVASLARAFSDHLATAKEAPGTLATVSADFVRIMTVHASKGLEFPHVAVADLGNGISSAPSIIAENVGDSTYASALYKPSDAAGKNAEKLRSFTFEDDEPVSLADARTPGEMYEALKDRVSSQTLAEARRLLYVALTRAGKSLMLSYVTRTRPELDYEGDGVYRDVFSALGWACDADECRSFCAYGGSAPARVDFHLLRASRPEDDGEGSKADVEDAAFEVRLREARTPAYPVPCAGARANVSSYSALASELGAAGADEVSGSAHVSGADSTSRAAGCACEMARDEDDDATALGEAFHRLAQLSIVHARARGSSRLEAPDETCVEAQIRRCGLSDSQEDRLRDALRRWFGSKLAAELSARGSIAAEVSFMVTVGDVGSDGYYLEGQIDALADDGSGTALIVDYKTGGFSRETGDELIGKHLLQARSYAYALLREGYRRVDARFVRVEHGCAESDEPQVVSYAFDESELDELERILLEARRS